MGWESFDITPEQRASADAGSFAPDGGQRNWPPLVNRLRAGDSEAVDEFVRAYGRGVEYFLRRGLGPAADKALLEETIAAALEGIRQGWLRSPADLAGFLRRTVKRRQGLATESGSGSALVRMKSQILVNHMRNCTMREREMLIRYYLHGQTVDSLLAEVGATEQEFLALKARVQQLVREPERRPAAAQLEPALKKAAAV